MWVVCNLLPLENEMREKKYDFSFSIDQCHQESCEQVNNVSEMTVQRLLLELETGGNVRFEDGKSTDPWYKSCHDLVLSRFCVGDYLVCVSQVFITSYF